MTAPANTEAIAAATGTAWEAWLEILGDAGGEALDHKALVAEAHRHLDHTDNPGWWAQSVAVAYEQHIGRRAPGQRQDGTYEATATRTHGGTLDEGIAAWRALVADVDAITGVPFDGEPSETATAGYRRWRVPLADGTRLLAQVSLRGERAVVSLTWSGLADVETRDAGRVALRELLAGL